MADPNANRPYSFEDLRAAVRDLDHAESVKKEVQGRWNSAKAALDSHQKEIDQADEVVFKAKNTLRKILGNMEK